MKLLLYDDFKLGVLQGEQVLDATAATVGLGHHYQPGDDADDY